MDRARRGQVIFQRQGLTGHKLSPKNNGMFCDFKVGVVLKCY